MIKLTDILNEILTEKKLCPKGKAYYNRRIAAGEKPSAYLSGRAVKVCKGLMKEDDLDESLRDWFEKEDWVRIDTQGNITGPCGTMKKGKATTRCLPRAKANRLTKAERAATARKKVAGSKKGKQFVANTEKAKVKFNK
jgi:poly-gamma-glutamate capsule biosynthesis protein CapA/YwtB (metallophosphatase superfamily)